MERTLFCNIFKVFLIKKFEWKVYGHEKFKMRFTKIEGRKSKLQKKNDNE